MIFATVGTQLPFDRLITAVDTWAHRHDRDDVFAQIGEGAQRPRFIEARPSLKPGEFRDCIERATLVVGHAGMGTIMSALECETPLIVMPRRAELGEHRNDHQLATVRRLAVMQDVQVAWDEAELEELLEAGNAQPTSRRWQPTASPDLLQTLRQFVGPRRRWSAPQVRIPP
jgi:UDP-N-acetylglucosamine transferase subunit ALG13